MKIVINPKNLVPTETWQRMRKVRAIVENEEGYFAITIEGGKCIFPGGKCENEEDALVAITRELEEEMGISFSSTEFGEVFELEALYDDIYDHRTNTIRPRYTTTTYYYVKTNQRIDRTKMHLTEGERREHFTISFVDKDTLFQMLLEDHSDQINGFMFDQENQVVLQKVFQTIHT